jgi:hypothetical protein
MPASLGELAIGLSIPAVAGIVTLWWLARRGLRPSRMTSLAAIVGWGFIIAPSIAAVVGCLLGVAYAFGVIG